MNAQVLDDSPSPDSSAKKTDTAAPTDTKNNAPTPAPEAKAASKPNQFEDLFRDMFKDDKKETAGQKQEDGTISPDMKGAKEMFDAVRALMNALMQMLFPKNDKDKKNDEGKQATIQDVPKMDSKSSTLRTPTNTSTIENAANVADVDMTADEPDAAPAEKLDDDGLEASGEAMRNLFK